MTVPELIDEAANNNPVAQRKLFDRYYEECMTYCNVQVRNRHDAEDLVSESFVLFFIKLHVFKYEGERSVVNWLKGIIRNKCRHHKRAQGRWIMVDEDMAIEISLEEDLLESLSRKELLEMIMLMKEEYSTVFSLAEIDGLSHAEIAEHLNININTSRCYLMRAKSQLQTIILAKSKNYGN
jgi:RNA polymerase sigma factor (sigma-70 family)